MQSKELSENLANQINEAHRKCMECDPKIVGAIVEKINHGRECGLLLQMAREGKRPPEWTAWINQNLEFSASSADQYLFVSRKLPDAPIDDSNYQMVFGFAKRLAIATGELAAPSGHGEQTIHTPNFLSFVARQLNNFKGEYEKQISRNPIRQWSKTAREQFVVQLEPVIEDMNNLLMEAKQSLSEA